MNFKINYFPVLPISLNLKSGGVTLGCFNYIIVVVFVIYLVFIVLWGAFRLSSLTYPLYVYFNNY